MQAPVTRRTILAGGVACVSLLMIPATQAAAQTAGAKMTTTASGLQFTDTTVGTGASPAKGQTCVMHYTGWLYKDGAKGQKFDSSVDRG